LEITDIDDATMQVSCTECHDVYLVETDAFNDGGMDYYFRFLLEDDESA